jgi:hypothetical protein
VEVVVALMLVAIGLLGVAGTSALARRTSAASVRERAALQRTLGRLALLSATGCGTTSGTSQGAAGTREWWTVTPAGPVAFVDVWVEWSAERGRRSSTLRSALLC